MKLIKSLNLMENKKVIVWLNVISIILAVLFFFLFSSIIHILGLNTTKGEMNFIYYMFSLPILFFIIVLHELIHGLFFKIFNKHGKVKFGFKNGMAYATSPHSYYSKLQFFIISIAPFVFITFLLFLCFLLGIIPYDVFILLVSIHAASCVGDFYWVFLIITSPAHALIEDTEVGINFYQS